MNNYQRVLSTILANKKASLIIFLVLAFLVFSAYEEITTPQRAHRVVQAITIDAYDHIFSEQKIISANGGPRRGSGSNGTLMDVTYQLSVQNVQQLTTAKHILTCSTDDSNCRVEDLGQVSNSAGDYNTSITSSHSYGEIDLYIDTKTNRATWIFRS